MRSRYNERTLLSSEEGEGESDEDSRGQGREGGEIRASGSMGRRTKQRASENGL